MISLRGATDEDLHALFDDEQSEIRNLIRYARESETVWYRSVNVVGSSSVRFKVPTNDVSAQREQTTEMHEALPIYMPMPDADPVYGSRPRRSARNRVIEDITEHCGSTLVLSDFFTLYSFLLSKCHKPIAIPISVFV